MSILLSAAGKKRLGVPSALDTFTGVDGTQINSRPSDSGNLWSMGTPASVNEWEIINNTAWKNSDLVGNDIIIMETGISNAVISVDISGLLAPTADDDQAYGIAFNYQDEGNYWLLTGSMRSNVVSHQLYKKVAGGFVLVAETGESGPSNGTIKVVLDVDTIIAYENDARLFVHTELNRPLKDLTTHGMRGYSNKTYPVYFDNFTVTTNTNPSCVINDPSPATTPVLSGYLRTIALDITFPEEVTSTSLNKILFGRTDSTFQVLISGATSSAYTDETLSFVSNAIAPSGRVYIKDNIPAGRHTIVLTNEWNTKSFHLIFLDGVSLTAYDYCVTETSDFLNKQWVIGDRGVTPFPTDASIHRCLLSISDWDQADVDIFNAGGIPIATDYEAPCPFT